MVGLGDIGGRLARLAKAFDMQVVGLRRHPVLGCGAADAVHAWTSLARYLPDADFVVLTCPLTEDTENLIGAEARRMKPTAYLVNVARGRVDLLRFSGEALDHSAATFSNCTGLVKSGPNGAGRDCRTRQCSGQWPG